MGKGIFLEVKALFSAPMGKEFFRNDPSKDEIPEQDLGITAEILQHPIYVVWHGLGQEQSLINLGVLHLRCFFPNLLLDFELRASPPPTLAWQRNHPAQKALVGMKAAETPILWASLLNFLFSFGAFYEEANHTGPALWTYVLDLSGSGPEDVVGEEEDPRVSAKKEKAASSGHFDILTGKGKDKDKKEKKEKKEKETRYAHLGDDSSGNEDVPDGRCGFWLFTIQAGLFDWWALIDRNFMFVNSFTTSEFDCSRYVYRVHVCSRYSTARAELSVQLKHTYLQWHSVSAL